MASSSVTVTKSYHTITVQAWPVPQGVRWVVTVDLTNGNSTSDPRRVEDMQIYLDGEFCHDVYQSAGAAVVGYHTLEQQSPSPTRQVYRGHVRRSLLRDQSRGVRTLTAALFDASGLAAEIARVDLTVDLSSAFASDKVIYRGMFSLSSGEFADPTLLDAVRKAGINALSGGVYTNPGDSGVTDEVAWEGSSLDLKLRPQLDFCVENGFYMRGQGDDFLRTTAERNWLAQGVGWVLTSVQRTAYVAQTYGGVLCLLDVMDEVDHNPGDTPADAVLVDNWRLYGGPRLGWPVVETQTVYPTRWEVPRWADYGVRYPVSLDFRRARSDGWSLDQYARGIERVRKDFRHPSATTDFPQGWDLSIKLDCNGAFYVKGGPGGNYNPATDTLIQPGWRPALIVAGAWIAMAYGATMFRMYVFDTAINRDSRSSSPNGAQLQSGSSPYDPVGDRRWDAVSACYGSVAKYEQKILAGPVTYRRYGNALVGENHAVRWVVNLEERAVPSPLGKDAGSTATLITPATGGQGRVYDGSPVPAGGVVVYEL